MPRVQTFNSPVSDPVRGHLAAGAQHPRVHRHQPVAAVAAAGTTISRAAAAKSHSFFQGQPAAAVSSIRLE